MKTILTFLAAIVRSVFPVFFPSQLVAAPATGIGMHFPNGRYQFFGRTNGASRHRKSNRLQMSRNTRNRQRRRSKH